MSKDYKKIKDIIKKPLEIQCISESFDEGDEITDLLDCRLKVGEPEDIPREKEYEIKENTFIYNDQFRRVILHETDFDSLFETYKVPKDKGGGRYTATLVHFGDNMECMVKENEENEDKLLECYGRREQKKGYREKKETLLTKSLIEEESIDTKLRELRERYRFLKKLGVSREHLEEVREELQKVWKAKLQEIEPPSPMEERERGQRQIERLKEKLPKIPSPSTRERIKEYIESLRERIT